jgi:hypothetical protein
MFNEQGLGAMRTFFAGLGQEVPNSPPSVDLTSDVLAIPLPVEVEVPDRIAAASRYDLAIQLVKLLAPLLEAGHRGLQDDPRLWSWLAMAWFRDLCPRDSQGRSKPGEIARWILTTKGAGARYFRHLLYGPYRVYRDSASPDGTQALLCDPIQSIGRLYYQLTSRIDLVRSDAVVGLTTRLYYDAKKQRLRPRSTGRETPGGIFRLVAVLNQLERTFDFFSLDPSHILRLLPPEFDRFR